ncbi:hypothetical protein EHS25_009736 [Saitozyma podzolica]|uniref:Ser-Thr-rich glycosyl-phosphatidyl-inositol-anchored membrane family-domain-containing protein n=1 Tax=Saitozyma podzolica TaxID=1890683 RepID=A0A427YK37_9TREE|nr:hypothetical protein EHS25_009736 [Saitozyma podzolica]
MLWLPLLALAGSAQAALTILYPTSGTIWYSNNTVTTNWTSSSPTTDTYLIRVDLSNQDQSLYAGNNSIADGINATSSFVTFKLPGVPPGGGYMITYFNSTNPTQALASSQAFTIAAGNVTTTSTSASASGTAAASSTNNIPNAATTSTPAFASSSAATSSKSAAGPAAPIVRMSSLVQGGVVLLFVGLGMGVLA